MEEEEETDEDDDAAGDLGKGKMRVGPEMLVKARLSDRGGPDVAIRVDEAATVRRITAMIEGKAQVGSLSLSFSLPIPFAGGYE